MGVLMDLMPCYGETTAPRPRKLVDVRYRARGPEIGNLRRVEHDAREERVTCCNKNRCATDERSN